MSGDSEQAKKALKSRIALKVGSGKGVLLDAAETNLIYNWLEQFEELKFRMEGLEK